MIWLYFVQYIFITERFEWCYIAFINRKLTFYPCEIILPTFLICIELSMHVFGMYMHEIILEIQMFNFNFKMVATLHFSWNLIIFFLKKPLPSQLIFNPWMYILCLAEHTSHFYDNLLCETMNLHCLLENRQMCINVIYFNIINNPCSSKTKHPMMIKD